jgi:hypothetical protein
MNFVQRVQDILLKPKETWPVIEAETADVASIYKQYLILLAAIPAVAAFIGLSVIGIGGFGFSMRVPLLYGLAHMVTSYVLSLAAVFALALIADALAPNFGGTRSQIQALKLVAYGCTAGFVGGLAQLIPMLGILGLIALGYSIYLIYLGAPLLMKVPADKSVGYTAVLIVCGLVAIIVMSLVTHLVLPSAGMGGMGGWGRHGGSISIKGDGGEIQIDTAKMEEAAKRMEAMGKEMEAAQKSGDSAAAGKALGGMVGAITGAGGGSVPVPAADLKALLPESVGSLKRESIEAQSNQVMGISGSSAKAVYAEAGKRLSIDMTDLGSMAGLAGIAAWANATVDRETGTEVEKVYKQGNRTVHEQWRKDGSRAEYSVITENGVVVELRGDGLDMAAVKAALGGLDLGRLEALKRAAKS